MRRKKTSHVPRIGHPRNTSGTDSELMAKERAGDLWDTWMTGHLYADGRKTGIWAGRGTRFLDGTEGKQKGQAW